MPDMSSGFGLGTLFHTPSDDSLVPVLDLVVVGSLSSTDGKNVHEIWSGERWPQRFFLKDFPQSRVLIFQRGFQKSEGLRAAIQRLGGLLVDVLDKFRQDLEIPLIVCCQGLGGYVFLEAAQRSDQEDRKENLATATTAAIFFGVPVSDAPLDDLRSSLRACRTIEQASPDEKSGKADKIPLGDMKVLASLLSPLKRKVFPLTAFAETKSLHYAKNIFSRSRIVVDKQLASVAECKLHEIAADHASIGFLDHPTYKIVSKVIRSAIDSRPTTNVAILNAPLASLTIQGPTNKPHVQRARRANVEVKCHHIPYPENEFFQGRTNTLQVMKERLIDSPGTKSTRAFALWGPPGQGKTQTALHFVFEHRHEFAYIFWVQADAGDKLEQGLQDCAVAAKLRKADTDVTAGARELMAHLDRTDERWLLVYDNAVSPLLINDWWPHSESGAILITARKQVFGTSTVANAGLELDKLSNDDGIEMILGQIQEHARRVPDPRQQAQKIVERVSGLALGIQAAIGLINDSDFTLEQYNKKYTDRHKFLLHAGKHQSHRNWAPYPQGLFETLTDTIQNVGTEARDLLEIFSLLDPDYIQLRLLEAALESDGLKDLSHIKDSDNYMPSLYNGIIARNVEDDGQRLPSFHIHRLLQDCVQLNSRVKSLQRPFEDAIAMVLAAMGSTKFEISHQMAPLQLKEYLPHVQALHNFYQTKPLDDTSPSIKPTLNFVKLLRKCASLCYKRGKLSNGLALVETGHDILGEDPGQASVPGEWGDKIIESMRLHHQHACIWSEVGNFELSLEHWKAAEAHYTELTKAGNAEVTNEDIEQYLGGIANSQNGLGRHKEAIASYFECFKYAPKDDIDSPYEVNICRTRWADGQFKEAAERLCKLIELREQAVGQKDDVRNFVMGSMLYVLGNVRISQNLLGEAYSLHERALGCWRKTYGEEHHKTGDAWHKKGWHEARLGSFDVAKQALQNALRVYETGSDRTFRSGEVARSSFKLSEVLEKLGEADEAEKYRAKALELRRLLVGHALQNPCEEDFEKLVSLWAR